MKVTPPWPTGLRAADPVAVKGDMAAGRLCAPFRDRVSSRGWAYWLIFPRERRMVPKVKRFREWLLDEMRQALEEIDGGWARRGGCRNSPAGDRVRISLRVAWRNAAANSHTDGGKPRSINPAFEVPSTKSREAEVA